MGAFIRGQMAVGDQVQAEVYKIKKKFIEARLTRLVQPSDKRTDPACAHFGFCGGCKWQHVQYEEQLRIKQKRIADVLEHVGGIEAPPVREALPAADIYHYRNKLDFSFADRRYLLEEEKDLPEDQLTKRADFALGFHAPRQFAKAIDIDKCHIATDDMNIVLNTVRDFSLERGLTCYSTKTHNGYLRNLVVRQAAFTGELMVNLVTSYYEEEVMNALLAKLQETLGDKLTTFVNNLSSRKNNSAFGEEEHVIYGSGAISEKLGEYSFEISANSFFQTNSKQAITLYDVIVEMAEPEKDHVIYDLYSGTGSISIYLSSRVNRVLGIECVESAIEDSQRNAENNGISNCEFRPLDLKDLRKVTEDLQDFGLPNVIITDPPRAGMHPKALETMIELGAERIIFVSCNPASLARDAKVIVESGKYRLTDVCPVDMFPHTNHIESVARFDRVDAE